MKILVMTARFPYPPFKGDQAIPFHRLKRMGKEHDITLLTFYQRDEELKDLHHIEPFCKKVVTVKKSRLASILHMLFLGLFSKLPFQVLYYRSKTFKKELKALLSSEDFGLVHVYMLRIAGYGIDIDKPKVLELIDSMQLNFQRRAESEAWPLKWLFRTELKRVTRYERDMASRYDRSIVVSDVDGETIGSPKVETVALGIDTKEFSPAQKPPNAEPVIAFTGNMGYYPNRHAILWFLEHCFHRIRQTVPAVRLIIAGKDPGPALKEYDNSGSIRVLGFVDSIAGILRNAVLAIAPMQTGSGMQFKILEAMACGTPIVATRIGLGSIPAKDGKNIFLADDPGQFADVCTALLKNQSLAAEVGARGLELVKNHFTWDVNVEKLNRIYNSITGKS